MADIPHGTAHGYKGYRCRCEECRRAWREYEPRRAGNDRYRKSAKGKARDARAYAKRKSDGSDGSDGSFGGQTV